MIRRSWSPTRWLAIGLLLPATVFLFYGGPDEFPQRSIKALWDLGHPVYFGLLTLLLLTLSFLKRLPGVKRWIACLSIGLALGFFIEFLQMGFARDADGLDILRDIEGSLLVLAFHPATSSSIGLLWRWLIRAVVTGLAVMLLVPFTRAAFDEYQANHQFPVLADFSTPFELDRWEGSAHYQLSDRGDGPSLLVDLQTTLYSGVALDYPVMDWRGYQKLNFEFWLPGTEPLRITLRINDQEHNNEFSDRFNRSFELVPGRNTLMVDLSDIQNAPETRSMDLSRIANLMFFGAHLPEPRQLYLERIYLSR